MKVITILFCTLLLTGCITTGIRTQVITPYIPPLPPKVQFEDVEWRVMLLPEIVTTPNGEMTTTNNIPYFALDAKNYENLSKNTAEITAYLHKLRVLFYSIQSTNLSTNAPKKKSFFRNMF